MSIVRILRGEPESLISPLLYMVDRRPIRGSILVRGLRR